MVLFPKVNRTLIVPQWKCRISCVGAINGCAPISSSEQGTGCSPMGVNCVAYMIGGGMSTCKKVWPRGSAWASVKLYELVKISIRAERSRKAERCPRRTAPLLLGGNLAHLRFSLTLPIHTFQLIKGKEKKQIIFLYIGVVVFLCNTVFVFQLTNRMNMAQAFLRLVRALGHSPHVPGILKNTSGPVGIPLKRGASDARQLA